MPTRVSLTQVLGFRAPGLLSSPGAGLPGRSSGSTASLAEAAQSTEVNTPALPAHTRMQSPGLPFGLFIVRPQAVLPSWPPLALLCLLPSDAVTPPATLGHIFCLYASVLLFNLRHPASLPAFRPCPSSRPGLSVPSSGEVSRIPALGGLSPLYTLQPFPRASCYSRGSILPCTRVWLAGGLPG